MVGRNDPCPCGSGKKYKQCCLSKQSEDQAEQAKARAFFDQKFKLTTDLYSFLAQKNGGEWAFDSQKIKSFDSDLGSIREGAGNVWAFFFREYDNGKRGIDWFVEERGKRYSMQEQEMLERWRTMKISCFQLVDMYEKGTIIEDIWSGERYRMPYCETMRKLPPWSVAVGMIEPYIEGWCIHGSFIWSHPIVKSEVMARVQQLQEETVQASGRKLPLTDIIAANYPEIISMCHRINHSNDGSVKNPKDMREYIYVTREYTCEDPEMLADMLLDKEDGYILSPGTDPAADKIVICRAEKLDHILNSIPVDRRERIRLNEIQLSTDLGNITMHKQNVTVSGWESSELLATLDLLESKWALTVGLTRIDERREAHQYPQEVIINRFNIVTDKKLSQQEVFAYSCLPQLLQTIQKEQKKYPMKSIEVLVRKKEYEQYRVNPNMSALNLLRIALGLPESPFAVLNDY